MIHLKWLRNVCFAPNSGFADNNTQICNLSREGFIMTCLKNIPKQILTYISLPIQQYIFVVWFTFYIRTMKCDFVSKGNKLSSSGMARYWTQASEEPIHQQTRCPLANWLSCMHLCFWLSLRWRYNGRDGVSNHQPRHCLLNRLFRQRSKKTSKLRVTGQDRWIPRTNGQLRGKCLHLMTSSWCKKVWYVTTRAASHGACLALIPLRNEIQYYAFSVFKVYASDKDVS